MRSQFLKAIAVACVTSYCLAVLGSHVLHFVPGWSCGCHLMSMRLSDVQRSGSVSVSIDGPVSWIDSQSKLAASTKSRSCPFCRWILLAKTSVGFAPTSFALRITCRAITAEYECILQTTSRIVSIRGPPSVVLFDARFPVRHGTATVLVLVS